MQCDEIIENNKKNIYKIAIKIYYWILQTPPTLSTGQ